MFENSSLLALSLNDKSLNYSVFEVRVENSILEMIRKNFFSGYEYFKNMEKVEFSFTYTPIEREECFYFKYDLKDIIYDAIRNPDALNNVQAKQFCDKSIQALFMGDVIQDNDNEKCIAVFKKITSQNVISKRVLHFVLTKDTYDRLANDVVIIPERSLALYEDGKLYFESYQYTNSIFGLVDNYKPASNKILQDFSKKVILNENNITLEDFAKTRVRKLIAYIEDSGILEKVPMSEFKEKALQQSIDLKQKNDKIFLDLDDRESAMNVLLFLSENTFNTTFTNQTQSTNSRKPLKKKNKIIS